MKTVHEVSRLAGVSIRTLQYYDKIGLLHPYDDTDLEKLQQILIFRELEFPLKDIKAILESPAFDRGKALEQQITLLTLKKAHLENLITLARGIKGIGVKYMDFSAFDTSRIDEYARQAKASWGNTPQYQEFLEKEKGRTKEQENRLRAEKMEIFSAIGTIKEADPASEPVQTLVKSLFDFINTHFYTCTKEIFRTLGKMYAGGGDITVNIDQVGGEGTAAFANSAIEIFCSK